MRRSLVWIVGASLVLSPVATADVGSADVAAAQVALRAQKLYAGPSDGHNGPMTTAALRALAPSIRSIDDARRYLGTYGRQRLGARSLRLGVAGWDVAAYQYLLAWQGFPSGPIDGAYTERTAAATRRLQVALGMAPDGIAGPLTMAAVRREPPRPPRPLAAPVGGTPSGGFGPRDDRFHAGLDFPAVTGTPVQAAAGGAVRFAGWDATGYGLLVVIDHGDGLETMYAHLSAVDVLVGQTVSTGATIGLSGATGRSNGPHLHFEARLRGRGARSVAGSRASRRRHREPAALRFHVLISALRREAIHCKNQRPISPRERAPSSGLHESSR